MKAIRVSASIISIFIIITLFAFNPNSTKIESKTAFPTILSPEDLNNTDAFSFSVISDNHGAGPYDNMQMARAVKWISTSKDEFVIGVGDHLVKNSENGFLSFLMRDEWWRNNFYPTIADAENDFFGKGQSDWGAGSTFLKLLNFNRKSNVEVRENGVEYYAQMEANGVTIHFISLHFPDQPYDAKIAFTEDSKNYLIQTLQSINKQDNDIIIVSAHSLWGTWIDDLNPAQQKYVMEKADLLLSGTTHYFERRTPKGYENRGALVVNAGSVNKARFGSFNGFLKIHVMQNPLALVVQHVNTNNSEVELMSTPNSYVKYINGPVYPLEFNQLNVTNYIAYTNN